MSNKVVMCIAGLLMTVSVPAMLTAEARERDPLGATDRGGETIAQAVRDDDEGFVLRMYRDGEVIRERELPGQPTNVQMSDGGELVTAGEPGFGDEKGWVTVVPATERPWSVTADLISSLISTRGDRVLVRSTDARGNRAEIFSATGALVAVVPGTINDEHDVAFSLDGDAVATTYSTDDTADSLALYDLARRERREYEFDQLVTTPTLINVHSAVALDEASRLVRWDLPRNSPPRAVWQRESPVGDGYYTLLDVAPDRILVTHAAGFDVIDFSGELIWRFMWRALEDTPASAHQFANFERWMLEETGVDDLRHLQPGLTHQGVLVLESRLDGARYIAADLTSAGRSSFVQVDDPEAIISPDGSGIVNVMAVSPTRRQGLPIGR